MYGGSAGTFENLCRLESLTSYADAIEESRFSDYRFRIHVKREGLGQRPQPIWPTRSTTTTSRTRSKLAGDRTGQLYNQVWNDLYGMQGEVRQVRPAADIYQERSREPAP